MNDAIIIQQVYKCYKTWDDYSPMLDLTNGLHQAYATRWAFDFLSVVGDVNAAWAPMTGGWAKIELIRVALEKGYKYVCWIDADAMIINPAVDLRTGCPQGIGMVRHSGPGVPGPHLNVGVVLIQNSARVKNFVKEWISRYPGRPVFPWYEQGEAAIMSQDPKWAGVVKEIDARWNSCLAGSNHTDDAVIEAWHGMGNGFQRYTQMAQFLVFIKSGKTIKPEILMQEGGLPRPGNAPGEDPKDGH